MDFEDEAKLTELDARLVIYDYDLVDAAVGLEFLDSDRGSDLSALLF